MKKFLKNVSYASIWTNDEPEGWICGKGFVGFIQVVSGERKETRDLWIVSTKNFYESRIQQKEVDDTGKSNAITYWSREGMFWNLNYSSRQLGLPKKEVLPVQTYAIEQIIDTYNKQNHVVCLLHGKAGGGKSMTVQYLCAELLKTKKSVNFCETMALHEQGDGFDSFYNKISPSEESPVVIVFEEVDGIIEKLHGGKIEQKHIPVQIKNKTDWNSFLDKFDREIYPHVILLMTTNKTSGYFDELDPSYMRAGRVNLKIEF
jgi:Cdc6-like AAA superfamily ATPase